MDVEAQEPLGPITPELALVSPELAAYARRLLPDRPWEQFAPSAATSSRPPLREEPEAFPPSSRLAPVPSVDSLSRTVSVSPEERVTRRDVVDRPRRWRTAVRVTALLAVFVGIVHLGAWESGGELLLPAPAASSPDLPGLEDEPAPAPLSLFTGDGVHFTTDATGTRLQDFVIDDGCAVSLPAIPSIAVRPSGGFDFRGMVASAAASFDVMIIGSFQSATEASGAVIVLGPGCPPGAAPFHVRAS